MSTADLAPDGTATTDPRLRRIPTPKFGATITNRLAGDTNPRRVGIFVRAGRNTGRMNRGVWWELTDGRGDFWQVSPGAAHLMRQEDFPHLVVDRSSEIHPPLSGAAS